MRIVFFSHYFPPEGNAPATRTYEHCVRWAQAGHHVTVVTCAPNVPGGVVYQGYQNRIWPQREAIDGLDVLRIWTYVAPNAGGLKRTINYASYMVSAIVVFLFFCKRPNLIVATSPQFFCGWAGIISSFLKWCPVVLEIRDIWPESIVAVGALKKGLSIRILEVLEKWMYRSANHIVAVGDGYKNNILKKVDVNDRISVVTNGVDLRQFPRSSKSLQFLKKYQLEDRFICSYVGTIGMAHGLEVVIRAAKILRENNRRDIIFCLIGDGARRSELQRQVRQEHLENWIRFTGRLDKSEMPMVLANSDCLLVHLAKTELFQSVIPSKIFEAMAMERPLIMGVSGEAADIVRDSKSGLEIEPDNENDLVAAVIRLCDDRQLYDSLCKHGRDFVCKNFSRDRLANDLLEILVAVAK